LNVINTTFGARVETTPARRITTIDGKGALESAPWNLIRPVTNQISGATSQSTLNHCVSVRAGSRRTIDGQSPRSRSATAFFTHAVTALNGGLTNTCPDHSCFSPSSRTE